MITIRHERPGDAAAREALLDLSFGTCRFAKTSERLREGRLPADGLSLIATAPRMRGGRRGRAPNPAEMVVGTVRLWHVAVADRPALLLGPLAVHPAWRKYGIGGQLMLDVLKRAEQRGHGSVLLVGDAPYYARFGFSAEPTVKLDLPGPVERDRFLACELVAGALDGARGLIRPTGLCTASADAMLVPRAA